jgi:SAM-dependent methyltransferase
MSDAERGQVSKSAAEVYEEFFVPALFAQWVGPMVDAARIEPGHRVLDVACGTGVVARHVAERVGSKGSVVGLDANEGMIAIAKMKGPGIEWRAGRAEELPFEANSFDAVVNQFALMFFENRAQALSEMKRVVRPNGRVAVAVWDSLATTPGYRSMTDLLDRLFGKDVGGALRAPFVLGDLDVVRSIFKEAGIDDIEIQTRCGTAHFPSIDSWVHTDVKGWTLRDMIDDAQFGRLLEEARTELARYVTSEGTVAFDAPAHIVTFVKKA